MNWQNYQMFGLNIASDRSLPALDPLLDLKPIDFFLQWQNPPPHITEKMCNSSSVVHESFAQFNGTEPTLLVLMSEDGSVFRFCFYDGVTYTFDATAGSIWIELHSDEAVQRAVDHLLYWLPGFLLGLKGAVCLQGAAAAVADRAVLLVGVSRVGKSTLAATLGARGFKLFGDDFIGLWREGERIFVPPSYPWISLRPSSLDLLESAAGIESEPAKPWRYYNDSFITIRLGQGPYGYQEAPLELGAIYLIDVADDHADQPYFREDSPRSNLLRLLSLANSTHIPMPPFQAKEMELLGDVVDRVPIRNIAYSQKMVKPEDLCDTILNDFDAVRSLYLTASH